MASHSNIIHVVALSIFLSSHCSFSNSSWYSWHCQCENHAHHSSCPHRCIAKCFWESAKARLVLISVTIGKSSPGSYTSGRTRKLSTLSKGVAEQYILTCRHWGYAESCDRNSSAIAAFFDMGTGCASAKYMDAVLPTESGGNRNRFSGLNKHLSLHMYLARPFSAVPS